MTVSALPDRVPAFMMLDHLLRPSRNYTLTVHLPSQERTLVQKAQVGKSKNRTRLIATEQQNAKHNFLAKLLTAPLPDQAFLGSIRSPVAKSISALAPKSKADLRPRSN